MDIEIINSLQRFLNKLKYHHWQSVSYNTHTVTGNLYTALDILVDNFVESYMGNIQEASFPTDIHIMFSLPSKTSNFTEEVLSFRKFLTGLRSRFSSVSELSNIVDEMLSLCDKHIFLLRMK